MTERDLEREQGIISLALTEFAMNQWTTPETREYIKKNMIPNAYRDWRENEPRVIEGVDW